MTKPWRLHLGAQRDIDEAFAWYEAQRAGLGVELARAVRARIGDARRMPGIAT
jgi:hypothetical protein